MEPVPTISQLFQRWMHDELRNRIAVNEKDGSLLVYVPAGEFEMGDGQDKDCPSHRVTLSAYWIGVYCVTNAQYRKFVDATGHRAPDTAAACGGTPVWHGKRFPAKKADHPVVCVSGDDAQAYAQWAGCELPTEAQWEKAARGPEGLIYPWGKDWDPAKCRHSGNKGNETTAPVYGYPGGVSGYGTYNQSGNVWEWCADRRTYQMYRGGSWGLDDPGRCRAAHRGWNDLASRIGTLGLRLVRAAS